MIFCFKQDYYKEPNGNEDESKLETADEYLMPEYLIEDVPLGLIQKVEKSYNSTYNSNELTSVLVYCKVISVKTRFCRLNN